MYNGGTFDVIVVGGGHAGAEAAHAGAKIGLKTLLLTLDMDALSLMACNPAIGGTAKGHIVRETDALGGIMGLAADRNLLQLKMLNAAKGPAVQSLRAQEDKRAYSANIKRILENTENLFLVQDEGVRILTDDKGVCGIDTALGTRYSCSALVLCTGVYLKSRVIIGDYSKSSGPLGYMSADYLSDSLVELGFSLKRFKTGTPARVDRRSLDFTKMVPQYGDERVESFSFENGIIDGRGAPCYLTYTNQNTHDVIRANLHRSPLYSGEITGVGPRYCPSIEDKVVKFPDKERHQMFIEPEGANTNEMYVQGMSSSLPLDVQIALYRTVAGMENAHFIRPAYAIEYDCIDAQTLGLTLESKEVPGLFFAGQINGTSGYEEAAGQGVLAGINAAARVKGEEPVILGRDQSYIGVLVDDLINKGTNEPYRMMTARAEYRLLLRQDNADERLSEIGVKAGLLSEKRKDAYRKKRERVRRELRALERTTVPQKTADRILEKRGYQPAGRGMKAAELLSRPNVQIGDLTQASPGLTVAKEDERTVENRVKYAGYIEKQKKQVDAAKTLAKKKIPESIDYGRIKGLRLEARAKLSAVRPGDVAQAARISGVSPADISVLLVYLKSGE